MTQSYLGELVGVTRQTVAAIEGEVFTSLETFFRNARVFEVGLDKVFSWDED